MKSLWVLCDVFELRKKTIIEKERKTVKKKKKKIFVIGD